jgi:hypothetical protein
LEEALSDDLAVLRNRLVGPEALENCNGSTRQWAKGPIHSAHVSDPAVQRGEVVLSGPGEIGVNHILNPALGNSGLGAHLRFRKELWARVQKDKCKNKPVYEQNW